MSRPRDEAIHRSLPQHSMAEIEQAAENSLKMILVVLLSVYFGLCTGMSLGGVLTQVIVSVLSCINKRMKLFYV